MFSSLDFSFFSVSEWLATSSRAIQCLFHFESVTVQFLIHFSLSLSVSEAALQRQAFHLQQNVSTFPPWNGVYFSAITSETS